MVKRLFQLLLISAFATSSYAQSENFRFKKLLAAAPDEPIACAIDNNGAATLRFLAEHKLQPKYITKEWVYVTIAPSLLASAQREKQIGHFHFEMATPHLLNDSTRLYHNVNEVHAGLGGLPQPYTGENVVFGYVDTGLDFNHPDFIDANGNTRVLAYWDHSLPFDAQRTPLPYGYGQAWDSTDINAGNCLSMDDAAHGSTVAGTGSGNGLANGTEKGMAPNSKIVMVETNFNLQNWTLTIADACNYIFNIADELGLPAVVNLSLGSYLGSHDGNDPASVLMEAMLNEQPGRIIVSAAGNSGARGKYHVHGEVDSDTSFVWAINNPVAALGANTIYFDLWSDAADFTNVRYAFGADKSAPESGFRGRTDFHLAMASIDVPLRDTIYSDNGDRIATMEIYTSIENGTYHMEVLFNNIDSTTYNYRFMTTGSGSYDLWSGSWQGLNDFVSVLPSAAIVPDIVHYHLPDTLQTIVSSWNCSEQVITVGNLHNRIYHIDHNGNTYASAPGDFTGRLSNNSSKGPTRLQLIKPDIVATGDVTLSAAPLWLLNDPAYNATIDSGGWHARNGGTSMASPVIAGIAAMYLEKNPTATHLDFKRDLLDNAEPNPFTGTLPNNAYGYGRAHALNTLVNGTSAVSELPGSVSLTVYPNPTTGNIHIPGIHADAKITAFDLSGKQLETKRLNDQLIDISAFVPGMYVLSVEDKGNLFYIKVVLK